MLLITAVYSETTAALSHLLSCLPGELSTFVLAMMQPEGATIGGGGGSGGGAGQAAGEAAGPAGCAGGGGLQGMLVPMLLLFGFMYFFLIRPQQKEQKQREAMLKALRKGMIVRTSGGLRGELVDFLEDTNEVVVRIADKTRVTILRANVVGPVAAEAESKKLSEKNDKKEEKDK